MRSSRRSPIPKTWPNTKLVTIEIDSISAIASEYDVIVFDQWGVLHDGSTPYPGAVAAIESLTTTSAVLSNSGKRSAPNLARITAMGFGEEAFAAVMTSGEALWRDINRGNTAGSRFFAVERAVGDAAAWADGLDITLVATPEASDAVLMMGLPDGSSLQDWDTKLKTWCDLQLPMYCSNPDRQSPRADGLVISPGALAYSYQGMGGRTSFYGKPHRPVFRAIEEVFGGGRYLMVGDSMEHDIAGACAAGWDSVLIQNGLYAAQFAAGDGNEVLRQISARTPGAAPTFRMEGLQ